MKRRNGIAIGGAALLAVGVIAAPGTAGTEGGKTLVTTTGGSEGLEITAKAAPGQANRIVLQGPQGQAPDILYVRIRDTKSGIAEDSPDCSQYSPSEVRCRAQSLRSLEVFTGDGRDRVVSLMSTGETDTWKAAATSKVRVFLGPGNDRLMSSSETDTWKRAPSGAASTHQVIAKGQGGDDALLGGTEDQHLSGGSGTDFLSGGPGAGDFCDGAADADKGGEGCEEIVSIP